MKLKRLALTAVFTAAALTVFVAEAQIPPLVALPGIKLGLANTLTLAALLLLGRREAVCVSLLRVALGAVFTGGALSFLYSFAGAACALLTMCCLLPFFSAKQLWALSAFAAIAHNLAQLCVAVLVLGPVQLLWYAPVLLIAAVLSGAFTGLCVQLALPRLQKVIK